MFRVTLPVLAAVATLASAGTASAQCCGAGGGLLTPAYGWNAGWGGGCCNAGASVIVAAPVVVQAAPIVVQQPVIVRQPVVIQQQPVVQQYVVNQGPVYSGPGITRVRSWYHPPRAVGAYPYVGARWGGYYRRAAWGPRPYWSARRAYWRHRHWH